MFSNEQRKELISRGWHTAFSLAVTERNFEAVKKILEEKKSDSDFKSYVNWRGGPLENTALHWSVANSNNLMTLFLLDNVKELDVNIGDSQNKTPLHLAIAKGWYHFDSPAVVGDVFDKSAPPQAPVIQKLIERTNLNLQDEFGNTPLHLAMMRRDFQVVDDLLKHGASLEIKNKQGQTPLDMLKLEFHQVGLFLINYTGDRSTFTLDKPTWVQSNQPIQILIAKHISQPTSSNTTQLIHSAMGAEMKDSKLEQKTLDSTEKAVAICKELYLESQIKKVEENKRYAMVVTNLSDLGIRNPNVYWGLLEQKIEVSEALLKLCQQLKAYDLFNSHVESAIITYQSSTDSKRSGLTNIEILHTLVHRLNLLRAKEGADTAVEKACKNLLNSGCFNIDIYKKLTNYALPTQNENPALTRAIAASINSLAEMGLLATLNDSHIKAICSISKPELVENMFTQIVEHITQYRPSR